MDFTHKEETLINFLIGYYKNKMELLKDILNQNTPLSLRLLDWLVTNYAKKYNIIYPLYRENEVIYFNIYLDYKNQLKAYSKKFFDPFCRQKRILINCNTLKWKELTDNEIIKLYQLMKFDKKNYKDNTNFVLLKDIGSCVIDQTAIKDSIDAGINYYLNN